MSKNQSGLDSVSNTEPEIATNDDAIEQQRAEAFQYFKSFLPVDIPWEDGDPNKECGAPLPSENYPFGCLEPDEQQASLSFVRSFYPCPIDSIRTDGISDELPQMSGMGKQNA